MKIDCPICGIRDRREFYYLGHAQMLNRPGEDADFSAWDTYLHMRDNPAGGTSELWQHDGGCGAWLRVERNTVTHEMGAARLVKGGVDAD